MLLRPRQQRRRPHRAADDPPRVRRGRASGQGALRVLRVSRAVQRGQRGLSIPARPAAVVSTHQLARAVRSRARVRPHHGRRARRAVARRAHRAFVLVDRRWRRPRARLRSFIMDYADFKHLTFEGKPNGVLLVTINRPEVLNAANARLHWEFTQIWPVVDADAKTRAVVVTGAGKAFSAGGDLALVEDMAGNPDAPTRTMREASDLVYNMINLDKPVVSAINGVAVGAGLVVALMADVSIIAETARFTDGHTRLGVAAGDHAAIIWPLLCGMAKAKYYLLTADFIDGREAERIGLVTMCLPPDQVLPKALHVADRLARGSQISIQWTKRALNNWLRQAGPIFDQSLALEMLSFSYPDVREGVKAIREKRAPAFPSAK